MQARRKALESCAGMVNMFRDGMVAVLADEFELVSVNWSLLETVD